MLVLGVAYKRDIDDFRESPALDVMAALEQKGARLSFHDPYVPTVSARDWPGGYDVSSVPLTPRPSTPPTASSSSPTTRSSTTT